MTLEPLRAFGASLETAIASSDPCERLSSLLCGVIIAGYEHDEAEQMQVARTAVRLDTARDDKDRFLALARDVATLIDQSATPMEVDSLLELVAERRRAAAIIVKHLDGPISRTGFLSYLTEQRWAPGLKRRIGTLTREELAELSVALKSLNVSTLRRILEYDF